MENPETDPDKYVQLTFDKGAKAIHQEVQLSQEIILEQLESMEKINKQKSLVLNLVSRTKINSTDFYVKHKTTKVLEKNLETNL